MDQLLKSSRGHLKFLGLLIVAALAMPASGVDVGEGAVEVSLPAVTDELPVPEGVLDGDCMNISLKNNDWSWDGVDRQQAEGETALLLRTLIKRLNNATQRIHDDNPNLNLTQFIRVVASRSSLLLLKIKSFARVFGQINSFYGYTCRNGKDLLRHALNRNITADEFEDFDDELSEEIDAAIDEVMGDENGDAEEGGEAAEEESGGEETEPGRGPGPKPNGKSLGMQNKTLAIRKRNKIAVRMFIKKALVALFLSPHRFKGSKMSLQEVIQRLGEDGRLGSIDQSKPRHVGGRNETADSTEVAGDDDVLTGIMGEDSDEIMDIFESVEWFDDEGDNSDVEDEEEVRRKFTLEGYLLKLMSVYVNKSASCARRVTRFIRQRAKHLPNMTDDEEEFTDLWKDYTKLVRQMNASGHQVASDGSLRNGGENSSSEVEGQSGNPLQEDGPLVSRIRNITQRLAEGKWRGKGGIEGRFYVVVLKMAQVINDWGKAGFLTNGTYFDADCSPGRSSSEGATTTCRICPTDASTGNLRMLLSELDDTIEEVYDGIRDRVDRLTKGTPKEKLTGMFKKPRRLLNTHGADCFTLTFTTEDWRLFQYESLSGKTKDGGDEGISDEGETDSEEDDDEEDIGDVADENDQGEENPEANVESEVDQEGTDRKDGRQARRSPCPRARNILNSQSRRIRMITRDITIGRIVRLIVRQSAVRMLKVLTFERVFKMIHGSNSFICTNAEPLMREALGPNATYLELSNMSAVLKAINRTIAEVRKESISTISSSSYRSEGSEPSGSREGIGPDLREGSPPSGSREGPRPEPREGSPPSGSREDPRPESREGYPPSGSREGPGPEPREGYPPSGSREGPMPESREGSPPSGSREGHRPESREGSRRYASGSSDYGYKAKNPMNTRKEEEGRSLLQRFRQAAIIGLFSAPRRINNQRLSLSEYVAMLASQCQHQRRGPNSVFRDLDKWLQKYRENVNARNLTIKRHNKSLTFLKPEVRPQNITSRRERYHRGQRMEIITSSSFKFCLPDDTHGHCGSREERYGKVIDRFIGMSTSANTSIVKEVDRDKHEKAKAETEMHQFTIEEFLVELMISMSKKTSSCASRINRALSLHGKPVFGVPKMKKYNGTKASEPHSAKGIAATQTPEKKSDTSGSESGSQWQPGRRVKRSEDGSGTSKRGEGEDRAGSSDDGRESSESDTSDRGGGKGSSDDSHAGSERDETDRAGPWRSWDRADYSGYRRGKDQSGSTEDEQGEDEPDKRSNDESDSRRGKLDWDGLDGLPLGKNQTLMGPLKDRHIKMSKMYKEYLESRKSCREFDFIERRLEGHTWDETYQVSLFYFKVLMKISEMIDLWGRSMRGGETLYDTSCQQNEDGDVLTTCKVCPRESAVGTFEDLVGTIDDILRSTKETLATGVNDWKQIGISKNNGTLWQNSDKERKGQKGDDDERKGAEGKEKSEETDGRPGRRPGGNPGRHPGGRTDQRTVYRLPGLVLDEHMFTLSYDEECTPFRLTYTIPMPQEGAQQTDGTEEEEEAESERGGDGETRKVISYDDFGAFRRAEQSLPEMPFLLNGKQAKLAKGSSNMIRIDNTNFTTNRELVISGKFCGLGSQLLLLCPTIDGRSRIRTDDAPSGKCHNISVFVEAPIISSARLTNEGDGIIIFFNKNVAIKDLRKCSSIFDKPSINHLGENAVCKWKDGKNLIVGLGCDATITTGSSITLKPDRIKAASSLFSHTASGTVNVLAPNDPKPPKAVIDGRPKVPACGQFALSGRPSTGGRSCGLTYEWALVNPTEGVDSMLTDKIQEANEANNDRMVSTTDALPEVTPHTFRLTVTNKLGLSNSTEFTIRKSNVREPWLEILKNGNIKGTKVSANKKFGLIAQFTFEQGTGCEKLVASRAEYQWTVQGVEFDEDALRKRGLRFLPSNLVGASEITATVTVTYGSPTDQKTKSASVTLTVVKAPLRARIKGGDSITVGTASDSVDLDCSFSNDPSYQGDEPDPGLDFRWGCWDETSILTCDLPSSQEDTDVAILTIEPSLLTIDKTYSISCYVNKAGFEEVHDSVKVSVTEGSPPRISLALLGSNEGSYKPGQDVEIRVMFNGNYSETVLDDLRGGLDGIGDPQNTVIIDKTREDQETAESDSQDSSSDKPYQLTISKKRTRYTVLLKIDKSILTPGSQYGLGVKVVSESSEGLAEIDFNVYDRVTGCTFEFGENGDYEDTDTDVTYEVSGCSVDSLEGLTYRAFTQFRSRKRLLGETSQDSTFTVDHEVLDIVKKRVEAGDAVDFKVGVKVCNTTSGVCSEFLKNATYAVGTLSEEELDEEKQQIQDLKLEGRSVEGLKKANRAQKARASQTTGVERKKRAAPDCDQVLLDLQYELLVEATSDEANYNYNPGDVLGMLQADTDVPITCLTLEQQRSTLASTKRVLESARDLEDRLPPETVDGVRQQLEDAKMTYPDAFFFSENRDIFGLLTKGMSKNMALGEKVSSFGESMFISMDYTLNTDAIQISRGDGDIVFLGGDDIKDRFDTSWVGCGCEDCVGILLESIVFRGQDYVGGESHDSDVFRLQFFSPCADSTDPIEVRDLSDPIRFWYPVSVQPNDRPVCSFLDQGTDEWSQEGLKAALDGTDVRCETNHTTEYVVDLINENGQSTSTIPEVTDTTTRGDDNDDDDDDDGHIDIPGINGLIGLGVGVVVGIVVAVIVVLAAVIILVVVVVKHVNKPKMIIEPVVKA